MTRQFTLRTAGAILTIFCLAAGYYASLWHAVARNEAVAVALEDAGAAVEVRHDEPNWLAAWMVGDGHPYVRGVSFMGVEPEVMQGAINMLAHCPRVEWLEFMAAPLTDVDLAPLSQLPELREIYLDSPENHLPGIAYLARLPKLERVDLSGCLVNNALLRPLKSLPLKSMALRRATIEEDLEEFDWLRTLRRLDVANCDFESETASVFLTKWLERADQVEELYLQDWDLDAETIRAVCRLRHLKTLDLGGCNLAEPIVPNLQCAASLEQIAMEAEAIDAEVVAALSRMPKLRCVSLSEGERLKLMGSAERKSWEEQCDRNVAELKAALPALKFENGMLQYEWMRGYRGQQTGRYPDPVRSVKGMGMGMM